MFPFSSSRLKKNSLTQKSFPELKNNPPKIRVPYHFAKNSIITYSETEIKQELRKYPGLLKTLSHAYQYQITFVDSSQQKQYWFCRNLENTMPLLKYLNQNNWSVDWQEKPFRIIQ